MKNYTFKTLNDKEFEVLIRDLLSKEMKIEFQNFKAGKDKGIDARYSTPENNNEIVVQAKHYVDSGYSQLKFQLKNHELPKIRKLNPSRYIIVTSLELNPSESEEIKEILSPYVKSINDIYWNQRVNALLSKFPEIERNHFKLWFSSSSVLSNILNNSSYLKSSFLEKEIESKVSHYVKTQFHEKALNILQSQKTLLITGAPGVGKTTLAQMIILDYINQGFQHLVIEDKISEAESLLSPDEEVKQIVYFDDFLGSNIYEILNPRNSESALARFISRIKTSPNKFLILTTRTTILNQALSAYEKIRYRKLHTKSNFTIYIDDYSLFNKAEILYNHVFFGEILEEHRNHIFENENYLKIIQHENYNPRLIEYFTSPNNISHISADSYLSFIIQNLNNPDEIWRNSFEKQISDEDRFLIFSLLSLRGEANISLLEETFNSRIESEIENYGFSMKYNLFNNSIKNIDGGYIKSSLNNTKEINISFINPSISDFLINFLQTSKSERIRLFQGIKYLEQITNIFHPSLEGYINFDKDESIKLCKILLDRENKISAIKNPADFELNFLKVILDIFPNASDNQNIIRLFDNLSFDIAYYTFSTYIFILKRVAHIEAVGNYVSDNWNSLILTLYQFAQDESDFNEIISLFDSYEQDHDKFIQDEENYNFVRNEIVEYLSDIIEDMIKDDVGAYSYTEEFQYYGDGYGEDVKYTLSDDIEEIIHNEFKEFEKMIFANGLYNIDSSNINIDTDDLVNTLEDSYLQNVINSHSSDDYDDYGDSSSVSEIDRIHDLFTKD